MKESVEQENFTDHMSVKLAETQSRLLYYTQELDSLALREAAELALQKGGRFEGMTPSEQNIFLVRENEMLHQQNLELSADNRSEVLAADHISAKLAETQSQLLHYTQKLDSLTLQEAAELAMQNGGRFEGMTPREQAILLSHDNERLHLQNTELASQAAQLSAELAKSSAELAESFAEAAKWSAEATRWSAEAEKWSAEAEKWSAFRQSRTYRLSQLYVRLYDMPLVGPTMRFSRKVVKKAIGR